MLDQSKEIKVCTYLGLTTLILSVALVGCGGSSSGGSSNTPKPSEPTPEVMTDITLKTPVEMRNVQLKVYDNTDNSILIDTQVASLTSYDIKLPSTKLNRLYRVEVTTQAHLKYLIQPNLNIKIFLVFITLLLPQAR